MQRQAWIQIDSDEATLIGALNDLDDKGYMPWSLRELRVEDQLDAVNPRTIIRILAHLKALSK